MIPDLLRLDYKEFYAGTKEEVQMRYRLAWSIAWFLEKGAPKLRGRPFGTLRADYMAALVKTRKMHEATAAVFTGDVLERFVAAWLKYWTS